MLVHPRKVFGFVAQLTRDIENEGAPQTCILLLETITVSIVALPFPEKFMFEQQWSMIFSKLENLQRMFTNSVQNPLYLLCWQKKPLRVQKFPALLDLPLHGAVLTMPRILCHRGLCCEELKSSCYKHCSDVKVKLQLALQCHFKHDRFRSGQLEAVIPAVHGKDVFVRMATGSGKTLCMLLPPLATNASAMGAIVSPLNGLMDKQVNKA